MRENYNIRVDYLGFDFDGSKRSSAERRKVEHVAHPINVNAMIDVPPSANEL